MTNRRLSSKRRGSLWCASRLTASPSCSSPSHCCCSLLSPCLRTVDETQSFACSASPLLVHFRRARLAFVWAHFKNPRIVAHGSLRFSVGAVPAAPPRHHLPVR